MTRQSPAPPAAIEPRILDDLLRRSLEEDEARGDLTTRVLEQAWTDLPLLIGRMLARQTGVLAGLSLLDRAVRIDAPTEDLPGLHLTTFFEDGQAVQPDDLVACVVGRPRLLHARERLIMNLVGHLSGIATLTRSFVDAVAGTGVRILHTRKTTPGLRELELHAVECGGGQRHRQSLASAIMLKENHFATVPGVSYGEVLQRVLATRPPGALLVAEATSLEEALTAARAGAEVVMLDNFPEPSLRDSITRVREAPRPAGAPPVEVEISGGVTLETVRQFARAGPDRISIGALTHSAPRMDLTFLVHPISTRHLHPPPEEEAPC